jgi:hypothetical protein
MTRDTARMTARRLSLSTVMDGSLVGSGCASARRRPAGELPEVPEVWRCGAHRPTSPQWETLPYTTFENAGLAHTPRCAHRKRTDDRCARVTTAGLACRLRGEQDCPARPGSATKPVTGGPTKTSARTGDALPVTLGQGISASSVLRLGLPGRFLVVAADRIVRVTASRAAPTRDAARVAALWHYGAAATPRRRRPAPPR